MSASVPRTKTPGVKTGGTSDSTQPELAPPLRPSPVGPHLPSPDPVRARRPTLVSPIPALLAASMAEVRDEGDGTPLPVDVRAEATSQFDASDHQKLMMDEGDDNEDYVVEVDEGD